VLKAILAKIAAAPGSRSRVKQQLSAAAVCQRCRCNLRSLPCAPSCDRGREVDGRLVALQWGFNPFLGATYPVLCFFPDKPALFFACQAGLP
jgi:hypothetical protein